MQREIKRRQRALLDGEEGCIIKPWGGKTRVALAYPNRYHVGMSSLGFQIIYKLFNHDPQVVCERVFFPSPDDLEIHLKRRIPLFTLESQSPLDKFHAIAFSVAFENDSLNLLQMLKLAGIPLRRKEREGGNFPLILAGGIVPSFNPEPLSEFVDVFLIGEGEALVPDLARALKELPTGDRDSFLKHLSGLKGVYVPAGYQVNYNETGMMEDCRNSAGYPPGVEKRYLEDLDAHPASSVILTRATEFGNMFLVEVGRGCSRRCGFCVVGHLWNPYRNRSPEVILHQAAEGLKRRKRIGLLGSAVCDHPQMGYIFSQIDRMGGEVSTSSLQIDTIDEQLAQLLLKGGRKSLTLAPEAGSDRLRRVIHKGIKEERILEAVGLLFSHGLLNLRLYFQVGLPTETDDDVDAIPALAKRIKHVMVSAAKKKDRLGSITLSISPFVPKPWTPFQWETMDEVKTLAGKIKHIKRSLARVGNINVIHDVPKYSIIQGLLARGDRKMGELLAKTLECDGNWTAALKEVNINPAFYVHRKREISETFPWDHIDVGITKDHLKSLHKPLT